MHGLRSRIVTTLLPEIIEQGKTMAGITAIESEWSALTNPDPKPYDFGLLKKYLWERFHIKNLSPCNIDVALTNGGMSEGLYTFDRAKRGGGVVLLENKQPDETNRLGQRINSQELNSVGPKQQAIIVHNSGAELLSKRAFWFDPIAWELWNGQRWVRYERNRKFLFDAFGRWYSTGKFFIN